MRARLGVQPSPSGRRGGFARVPGCDQRVPSSLARARGPRWPASACDAPAPPTSRGRGPPRCGGDQRDDGRATAALGSNRPELAQFGALRPPPVAMTSSERWLIRAARRGDAVAEAQLLRHFEPLVRRVAATFYLPGGDSDDLAQSARVGLHEAIHAWEPDGSEPFGAFARSRAMGAARNAVDAARAGAQQPLNGARCLHTPAACGLSLEETLAATGRADEDPVAKAAAREQLDRIVARVSTLSALERGALALRANGVGEHQIACALGVEASLVDTALDQARRKLLGHAGASIEWAPRTHRAPLPSAPPVRHRSSKSRSDRAGGAGRIDRRAAPAAPAGHRLGRALRSPNPRRSSALAVSGERRATQAR
jgi:RNA polymerase sporulation-specific sigma factor